MNVGKEAKIYWISILQGWSMLLVVIGHVTLTNIFENPATPISAEVERIIYGFHMPLPSKPIACSVKGVMMSPFSIRNSGLKSPT